MTEIGSETADMVSDGPEVPSEVIDIRPMTTVHGRVESGLILWRHFRRFRRRMVSATPRDQRTRNSGSFRIAYMDRKITVDDRRARSRNDATWMTYLRYRCKSCVTSRQSMTSACPASHNAWHHRLRSLTDPSLYIPLQHDDNLHRYHKIRRYTTR